MLVYYETSNILNSQITDNKHLYLNLMFQIQKYYLCNCTNRLLFISRFCVFDINMGHYTVVPFQAATLCSSMKITFFNSQLMQKTLEANCYCFIFTIEIYAKICKFYLEILTTLQNTDLPNQRQFGCGVWFQNVH